MQKVRGFIFFEGKTSEEIREAFNGFKLDLLGYVLFNNLKSNGEVLKGNGIFVYGEIGDAYSSKDIANALRKHAGLEEAEFEKIGAGDKTHYKPIATMCDVSVEKEDYMKEIKKSKIEGNYIGIRVKPPLNIVEIQDIARELGSLVKAGDIYLRGAEIDETAGKPKICIEAVTDMAPEKVIENFEDAYGNRLKVSEIRTANLFA
jgi:hypothetical protein